MNPGDVSKRIERLGGLLTPFIALTECCVYSIESKIEHQAHSFQELTEYKISEQTCTLTNYITYLYLEAEYHALCVYLGASPSPLGLFLSIAAAIDFVYSGIKWVVDFFNIKEILKVQEIIYLVSPQYREWRDNLFAKISEYSGALNLGLSGLLNLYQAGKSGLNVLGGLLGKDEQWLELKSSDSMIPVVEFLAKASYTLQDNPGKAFDWAYRISTDETYREVKKWWEDAAGEIFRISGQAYSAITKVNDTIDDLQDIRNQLPAFIRDNIPQSIFDGINWLDTQIDDTILPAITKINKTFDEVNAILEAHRKAAEALVDQLIHPGDLLLGMDQLTKEGLLDQENKIDDAASRKYERDTDAYEFEDAGIIKEFERIAEAMTAPLPPPVFLTIEEMPAHLIPGIVLEDKETWFVGDF